MILSETSGIYTLQKSLHIDACLCGELCRITWECCVKLLNASRMKELVHIYMYIMSVFVFCE
jgi:hypothetical protein